MQPFVVLSEGGNTSDSASESFDNSTPLSTPPSITHDTSRAGFHKQDLESFAKDLQTAADRAFPNEGRNKPRYRDVSVLLLRWEDDEMNVDWELEDLDKVFMKYGFNTERWLIPRKNAHLKLMSKAIDIVEEHDGKDDLVIVYYAGHAFINAARQATWCCKRDPNYASLEWSAIQTLFEKAQIDVLLLLDCCAAASAAPTVGAAVTETIAACGFESTAPQPGRCSFTNTLIEVLEDWIDCPPFSAAMLHNKVLSQLKHEQPERIQSGRPRKRECRTTPIFIVATSDPRLPSIELGRRRPAIELCPVPEEVAAKGSVSGDKPRINTTEATPQTEENPAPTLKRKEYDRESIDGLTGRDYKIPRVIISLALDENQNLNSDSCQKWLASCPTLIKFAKIEAVFKSFSTLLLISMPVFIWNLLPEDPACAFVGYATSMNMLADQVDGKSSRLEVMQAISDKNTTRSGQPSEHIIGSKGSTVSMPHTLNERPGFNSSVHDHYASNAQAYDKSLLQKLGFERGRGGNPAVPRRSQAIKNRQNDDTGQLAEGNGQIDTAMPATISERQRTDQNSEVQPKSHEQKNKYSIELEANVAQLKETLKTSAHTELEDQSLVSQLQRFSTGNELLKSIFSDPYVVHLIQKGVLRKHFPTYSKYLSLKDESEGDNIERKENENGDDVFKVKLEPEVLDDIEDSSSCSHIATDRDGNVQKLWDVFPGKKNSLVSDERRVAVESDPYQEVTSVKQLHAENRRLRIALARHKHCSTSLEDMHESITEVEPSWEIPAYFSTTNLPPMPQPPDIAQVNNSIDRVKHPHSDLFGHSSIWSSPMADDSEIIKPVGIHDIYHKQYFPVDDVIHEHQFGATKYDNSLHGTAAESSNEWSLFRNSNHKGHGYKYWNHNFGTRSPDPWHKISSESSGITLGLVQKIPQTEADHGVSAQKSYPIAQNNSKSTLDGGKKRKEYPTLDIQPASTGIKKRMVRLFNGSSLQRKEDPSDIISDSMARVQSRNDTEEIMNLDTNPKERSKSPHSLAANSFLGTYGGVLQPISNDTDHLDQIKQKLAWARVPSLDLRLLSSSIISNPRETISILHLSASEYLLKQERQDMLWTRAPSMDLRQLSSTLFSNSREIISSTSLLSTSASQSMYRGSPRLSRTANLDEIWTKVSDLTERRRIQNRIAQRNYRKKLKRRLEDFERRAKSSAETEVQTVDGKNPDHSNHKTLVSENFAVIARDSVQEQSFEIGTWDFTEAVDIGEGGSTANATVPSDLLGPDDWWQWDQIGTSGK